MRNEHTEKLWKVVVVISHARSDGNGESGRETKTRYFDDFKEAAYFADNGDIKSNNFFACVASRAIYEYDVSSVRQLELKKREIVSQITKTERHWE